MCCLGGVTPTSLPPSRRKQLLSLTTGCLFSFNKPDCCIGTRGGGDGHIPPLQEAARTANIPRGSVWRRRNGYGAPPPAIERQPSPRHPCHDSTSKDLLKIRCTYTYVLTGRKRAVRTTQLVHCKIGLHKLNSTLAYYPVGFPPLTEETWHITFD